MVASHAEAFCAPEFLIIGQDAVRSLLDVHQVVRIAESALRKTSDATAIQDVRRVLEFAGSGGGCLSVMYADVTDQPAFGAKVLSVHPGNFRHGLPSHRGGVLLFERRHGRPSALIDGSKTTVWRTAAASAVATRALSRPESSTLTLLGYGEQVEAQQRGAHIRVVGKPGDGDWTAAFLQAIARCDVPVAVVAGTMVHWFEGTRIDLQAIARARSRPTTSA